MNDAQLPSLEHFGDPSVLIRTGKIEAVSPDPSEARKTELMPAIEGDVAAKDAAMDRIAGRPFSDDPVDTEFAAVQNWITECAKQVVLPLNFCGGILIVRLCRRLVPLELQTDRWADAIHELAAAYDFAFLALAHADDEADLTKARNGVPTRWVTHPQSRAVDGVNLILAGITHATRTLAEWPRSSAIVDPSTALVLDEVLRALRDASYPILFDRSGIGHVGETRSESELSELIVDNNSLARFQLFVRHRAHSYFMHAFRIAVFACGYRSISPRLEKQLGEVFDLLGTIGAASDDLQDSLLDIVTGIHSIVLTIAHLCVAEDEDLRPSFRKSVEVGRIASERERLNGFKGKSLTTETANEILNFLDEIQIRNAIRHYYLPICAAFSKSMHSLVKVYGISEEFMVEIVGYVSNNADFSIPSEFIFALKSFSPEVIPNAMHDKVGEFIVDYFLDRFWPKLDHMH